MKGFCPLLSFEIHAPRRDPAQRHSEELCISTRVWITEEANVARDGSSITLWVWHLMPRAWGAEWHVKRILLNWSDQSFFAVFFSCLQHNKIRSNQFYTIMKVSDHFGRCAKRQRHNTSCGRNTMQKQRQRKPPPLTLWPGWALLVKLPPFSTDISRNSYY